MKLYTAYVDFADGSRATHEGLTLSDLLAVVGTFDNLTVYECSIEAVDAARGAET